MKPNRIDRGPGDAEPSRTAHVLKTSLAVMIPLLLVILGGSLLLLKRPSSEVEAVKAEMEKRGLPVTLEEYCRRRGEVPDSENGALLFEQAFSIIYYKESGNLPSGLPLLGTGSVPLPAPNEPASEAMVKEVREFVEARGDFFALLRKGARFPRYRYSTNWADGAMTRLSSYLTGTRQSARCLALAAWLDAVEGRGDEAAEKVRDVLALLRSPDGEPSMTSIFLQSRLGITAVESLLAQVLTRCSPSEAMLVALQRDLESTAESITATSSITGEILQYFDIHERVQRGDDSHLREVAGLTSASPWNLRLWKTRWSLDHDVAAMARYCLELLKITEERTPEAIRRAVNLPPAVGGGGCLWRGAQNTAPILGLSVVKAESTRALLRSAAAAVAALRFSRNHGRWPETLAELVPDYIANVPHDPFSGEPLVYNVLDDGIMIYSVGQDRRDDDRAGFRIWQTPGTTGAHDDSQ